MPSPRTFLSMTLAALSGTSLAVPVVAQLAEPTPAERLIEVLRLSRAPERPPDDELLARLAPGAEPILPAAWEILVTRRVPATGEDTRPQTLSVPQRELLRRALTSLDAGRVRAFVRGELAAGDDADRRWAAIELVGAVGRARDLPHVTAWTPRDAEERIERRFEEVLRGSVAAILARDPRAYREAETILRDEPDAIVRAVLLAVGDARSPLGLAVLRRAVDLKPGEAPVAVAQVRRVGRSGDPDLDRDFVRWMSDHLAGAKPNQASALLQAIGELDEGDAVPDLIAALDDPSEGVRRAAHDALHRVTGLALPPGREVWTRWHGAERAWILGPYRRAVARLASADIAVVAGAVREIGAHRLYPSERALALAVLLDHTEARVRALACRALGEIGSPSTAALLLDRTDDPAESVSAAAWAALERVTRQDLPREREAWLAWIEADSNPPL